MVNSVCIGAMLVNESVTTLVRTTGLWAKKWVWQGLMLCCDKAS